MFWKIYDGIFLLIAKIWLIAFMTIMTVIDLIYRKTIYNEKNTRLHFYYKFFVQYLFIIVGCSTVFFVFLLRPGYEGNISITAPAARYAARILDNPVTIRNRENLAIESAAIATINHQSMLDLIVTLNFWDIPKKLVVLGKSELKYVPPYGPMGLLAGLQFINRNKSEKARAQLKKIGQTIKERQDWFLKRYPLDYGAQIAVALCVKSHLRQVKMLVYPEGTRNQNREEFLPFKKGAFHTAISAQIPIIPIVISPYYFLDHEKKIFGSGRIIIQILEPIPTEGMTQADVPALAQKVRDVMSSAYKELTKEVLAAESEQKSLDLALTQKLL